MPNKLSDVLPKLLERLPDAPVANSAAQTQTQQAEQRRRRAEEIQRCLDQLLKAVGPRYRTATLENYEAREKAQQVALGCIRAHCANLADEIKAGRGILLFGPSGTGKDHLLVGLARQAIALGCTLTWENGVDLYAKMRETIQHQASEEQMLSRYRQPQVLVLSDPMPPSGALSDYQAATLYRIVDYRYRHLLPVWCSLNVADSKEAAGRLGPATVDRLCDGAWAIECKWPSWRKVWRAERSQT